MNQLKIFPTTGKNTVTLNIDGASRGNPGPASLGYVIMRGDKVLEQHGYYIGKKTNNQAEYAALVIGVHQVRGYIEHTDELLIISDSELLVKQINGDYRVKHPDLQPLFTRAKQLLAGIDHRVTHVLRAHNTQADLQANKALDEKTPLTTALATVLAFHE